MGKLWGYEVRPGSQKKEWAPAFESNTRKLQDPIILHAESILTKAEGNTLSGLAGLHILMRKPHVVSISETSVFIRSINNLHVWIRAQDKLGPSKCSRLC